MRYKIGDRVKILKSSNDICKDHIGLIGYVAPICNPAAGENNHIHVISNKDANEPREWAHCASLVERITESPKIDYKFKIGDKVSLKRRCAGDEGIIVAGHNDFWEVECSTTPGFGRHYLSNDDVELIEEEEVLPLSPDYKIGDKVMTKTRCDENGEIVTIKNIAYGKFLTTTCERNERWHCMLLNEIEPIETEEKQEVLPYSPGTTWVDIDLESPVRFYASGKKGSTTLRVESLKDKEVRNKTMAIAIGEKYVPIRRDRCGTYDSYETSAYVIFDTFEGGSEYIIYDKNGNRLDECAVCLHEKDMVAYNPVCHKKGLMKQLSIMAAKLVDADVKAFVEAGILDSELNITEEGESFVLTQVLNANKKEYAVEARKMVADAKKEKECK